MSLGARLRQMEVAERDAEARQLAAEAGLLVDDVRRQFELWDRLLVVHGLEVGEPAELERVRAFLTDFAMRLGDEDPERYVAETIAEWTAEDAGVSPKADVG